VGESRGGGWTGRKGRELDRFFEGPPRMGLQKEPSNEAVKSPTKLNQSIPFLTWKKDTEECDHASLHSCAKHKIPGKRGKEKKGGSTWVPEDLII